MAAPPAPSSGFKLTLKLGGSQSAVSAAPAAPAQPAVHPPYPPQPPTAPAGGASSAWGGQGGVAFVPGTAQDDEDDEEQVSATKYRKLKRKYHEAVTSRDDASLALFRAQKLIHRLREDKSSLLDRVLQLEVAAGITSEDVSVLYEQTLRADRERAFPLLNPPSLPSMGERPQKAPVIRTDTDLSNPNYNKPLGPAPLPETLPPHQRSHHLRTAIAAQKLRDEYDARRSAMGLPKPFFPAVAVLGLEGSSIAANVERALSGETLEAASEQPARGSKRRRESSAGVSKGKGRAPSVAMPPPPPAPVNNLPNPFASFGAVPVGSSMSRNNAEALAASSAPALPPLPAAAPTAAPDFEPAQTPYEDDIAMDDGMSDGFGAGSDEDGGAYKPAERKRGGRKSAGGAESAGFKPKKVRAHGLTSGTYTIPTIARNPDGTARLPITVGIMTISSLGNVDMRDDFHTERYIFPVGYEAKRRYMSMIDPNGSADYVCKVLDGGDNSPRFELHPSDQPGVVISAGTPTGAWTQVLRAANKVRVRQHSGSVSGPDYYGFSHNTVKALIQELPGANQVPGYIWQTFVESGEPPAAERRGSTTAKKVTTSRRRAARDEDDAVEASPAPYDSIEVGDGGEMAYGGDYAINGEYDSPAAGGYGEDYSAAGSPSAFAAGDFAPTSLQHLLAAAGPSADANPYAIPTSGGGALDPFLAVTAAATAAAAPVYDPYAIPEPAQPMIDPAFGDYGASANAFAYGIPDPSA
ncbi:hypothetical protein JCM10207_008496 [Rhodosporidiobolus poonsookiae]